MPKTDERPDDELEDLDGASRVNFRDYPSSGLVVIAALSSGLGWMLFKWLGRKRKARNAAGSEGDGIPEASARETPSTEKKP